MEAVMAGESGSDPNRRIGDEQVCVSQILSVGEYFLDARGEAR